MRELLAAPEKYSKLIELQCRLAREIQALQKNRDDTANALGRAYNPERLKRQNEEEIEQIREVASSKIGTSPPRPTRSPPELHPPGTRPGSARRKTHTRARPRGVP